MVVAIDEASKRLSFGPGLRALVGMASASHRRAALALVVVCLCAFLPGFFTIPPVDRDEARFAQATKQMIESGDYVDIRFQDESRYKKPVGIYWLQAAFVKLGEAAGVPRAHPHLALSVALADRRDRRGAGDLLGGARLRVAPRRAAGRPDDGELPLARRRGAPRQDRRHVAARLRRRDGCARPRLSGRGESARADPHPWGLAALFWTALAAGILLKGPLILMFVGLAAVMLATLGRSFAWLWRLKPLPGIAWMLLLVLPWFIAIVAKRGDSFFTQSLGQDMFAKIGSAQESHGAPPGTYLLLFFVTFWPGAMLAPLAAPAIWRARGEPGARFLLAWIVPAWIVLEIVVTKLPHYVLPLYPAIAILIAGAVDNGVLTRQRWLARAPAWWFILSVVGAVLTIAINVVVGQQAGVMAWPFLVAAMILALFAWWLLEVDGPETALLRAVAATILFAWALFGITLPSIPRLFPAQELSNTCASPRLRRSAGRDRRLSRGQPGVPDRDRAQAHRPAPGRRNSSRRRLPLRVRREPRRSARSRSAPRRSACATAASFASTAYNISGGRSMP